MGVKIILLYLLILMVIVVSARDRIFKNLLDTRRNPNPVSQHPYFSSVQFYFFEGVDYDYTNEAYLKEHNDCYGEFLRCTRARITFEPVCGLDVISWWFEDFDNICQLEMYNCRYRVFDPTMKEPVGGVNILSNRIFYNGWDVDCKIYTTRRNREEAIKQYCGEEYVKVRAIRNELLRRGIVQEHTTEPIQLESKGPVAISSGHS